jgi:hypothetical protein
MGMRCVSWWIFRGWRIHRCSSMASRSAPSTTPSWDPVRAEYLVHSFGRLPDAVAMGQLAPSTHAADSSAPVLPPAAARAWATGTSRQSWDATSGSCPAHKRMQAPASSCSSEKLCASRRRPPPGSRPRPARPSPGSPAASDEGGDVVLGEADQGTAEEVGAGLGTDDGVPGGDFGVSPDPLEVAGLGEGGGSVRRYQDPDRLARLRDSVRDPGPACALAR